MKSTAYSRWASYFKSMCGKFGLRSHIDGTMAPQPQDPAWDQADCCVRSWFFGSVDDSVLDLAMTDDDQTAQNLWLTIKGLFRTNRQSRAIFLSHDFHSMTQGDSIAEYCGRMKTLADALRDVADDIANSTAGFPSFAQARDMLALKELRLANEEVSTSTALLAGNASSSSSGCPGGCRPPAGPVQPGGSSTNGGRTSGGGNKKRWQQKKGGGGFQAPSGNPRPTGPWFCFSPRATSYDAPGFQQADSQGSGGWHAGAPGLLSQPPQALAALNQMALQNGGWVVDSGASGHMSSTD
ncbi:uncharacterized protein, partial [Miscanthus floridulus]|uniref:uncharacterized protein n=1 Tax=Miscanthus floridulus TaxID=154761 RepID=UPI00345861BA